MSHTPAPWSIEMRHSEDGRDGYIYAPMPGEEDTCLGQIAALGPQCTDADARLIAAAPDLAVMVSRLMCALADETNTHIRTGRADEAERLWHIPDQEWNARIMAEAQALLQGTAPEHNPRLSGQEVREAIAAAKGVKS